MSILHWLPVGIIGAGLFFGLLYAFFRGGKLNETGLLKTPDGKPIQWDVNGGPVNVYYSATLLTSYREHWERARLEIQQVTGRTILLAAVEVIDELEALLRDENRRGHIKNTVFVCDDEGVEPEHGRTDLRWDMRSGFLLNAVVTLPEVHVVRYGYGIVLHEMMHVLGFDHDATPASIMWPRVQERPGSITQHDQAILKTVYG